MTRAVLGVGAAAFLVAGMASFVAAAVASEWIVAQLPPLITDAAAIGGALTAFGVALTIVSAAHAVVILGLRDRHAWAVTAGILLAALLAVAMLGLVVTSAVSALRLPELAPAWLAGAVAAAVASAGYAWCGARLVADAVPNGPDADL